MAGMDIGQLRGIASQSGVGPGREVSVGGDGGVKAERNLLGRIVTWFRGPGEAEVGRTRETVRALVETVRQSYGDRAASAAFESLIAKYDSGKPVTERTVKRVLDLAEATRAELRTGNDAKAALFTDFFANYGEPRVPAELQGEVTQAFLSAIGGMPESNQRAVGLDEMQRVWNEAATGVLDRQQARLAQQAPNLSGVLQSEGIRATSLEGVFHEIAKLGNTEVGRMLNNALSNVAFTYDLVGDVPMGPEAAEAFLNTLEAQRAVLDEQFTALKALVEGGGLSKAEGRLALALLMDMVAIGLPAREPELHSATLLDAGDTLIEVDLGSSGNASVGGNASLLDGFKENVQRALDADPLSPSAIHHAQQLWVTSGANLLADETALLATEHLASAPAQSPLGSGLAKLAEKSGLAALTPEELSAVESHPQVGPLVLASQALLEKHSKLEGGDLRRDPSLDAGDKGGLKKDLKARMKEEIGEVRDIVRKALEAAGRTVDKAALDEALNEYHLDAINNEQDWGTITKDLQFVYRGAPVSGQSEIVPACDLGSLFVTPYEEGTGINCASTGEDKHSVNLATTRYEQGGEVLFEGVRHGVHCAFGMEPGPERVQANLNRAQEAVIAALSLRPELMQRALGGETVPLALSSVSLMTTDLFRDNAPGFDSARERTFTREQLDAWATLSDPARQPVEIEMRDADTGEVKTVKLDLRVMAFSFGVNQGAVVGMGPLSSETELVGGWEFVRADNEKALSAMLGDLAPGTTLGGVVGEYLARTDVSAEDRRIVSKLAEQVRAMWQDGSYMHMGNEPYKMAARLAVLSHRIGVVPEWNCKSGKDRTGMLDGEAKFLATRIALSGDVPEPDAPLDGDEQGMLRQFLLHGGNHEMQILNTGLAGFKTEGVSAIDERLGTPEARAFHRGASLAVSE